jgi:hypothetical protein
MTEIIQLFSLKLFAALVPLALIIAYLFSPDNGDDDPPSAPSAQLSFDFMRGSEYGKPARHAGYATYPYGGWAR